MTRNQRRKLAAARQADKVERMASAEIANRNAKVIAANVGQLRNGVKFETSGDLSPRAYRDYAAHSGTAHVSGERPRAKTPFVGYSLGNRAYCPGTKA